MSECINLGHMKSVSHPCETNGAYYLPHHPVIRPSSINTNVRVVFDGSAKTEANLLERQTLGVFTAKAAIKSVKYHLARVLISVNLTFEVFATLLSQI